MSIFAAYGRPLRLLYRKATSGVDKATLETYGEDLRTNLENLLSLVHSGVDWATKFRSRRRNRIETIRAVVILLQYIAILEVDRSSSGGGRGLGCHRRGSLILGLLLDGSARAQPGRRAWMRSASESRKKVNYVLYVDIRAIFSKFDHSGCSSFSGT